VSADAAPAVRVERLVKAYDGRVVVDHLDLQAPSGAVTAVLGPNGAGKTTTIEICEGLRRPDSGLVEVLGLSPTHPDLRSRVGVMLQEGGVYGSVSSREALSHAASLYSSPQPPDLLIETLGLADVATVPSRRLSGGQRQRLGLALAIVGRPELVFLDEPTAGLDPHVRRQVWDLVVDLRAAGVCVVLTTHYLEEAEHLADQVVIVDGGRVIAAGHPRDLVSNGGADARLVFTASPGLELAGLIRRLPDGSSARETGRGSYEVRTPGLGDAVALVSTWFTECGVTPTSISSAHRSLEDVFLELTSEDDRP
jgi:ABC-2 type transport system ATP-binding protein